MPPHPSRPMRAMFPIRPIRPVHPYEPAAPPLRFSRRSISHLLFSLPIREAFSWADTCAAVHSQVGTLPTARQRVETLRPTACESALGR